ncbi:hypothetical protein [Marinobacter sp. LN3S78]|uniref:hypothetical protein n=1 Tax=Marinobacter sp. LN3S78 TaxID=3382300 RepID=UPI00387AC764
MIESYTSNETINGASAAAAPFFDALAPEGEGAREAVTAIRRASAHRLVKAAKSPTEADRDRRLAKFWASETLGAPPWPRLINDPQVWAKDNETPGTWAVVERRDWCGEYRLRMETRAANSDLPPEQNGDRVTDMLTDRGARKISESCYFTACRRGGFTTFLTLTLSQEAREKLGRRVLVAHPRVNSGLTMAPSIEAARAKPGPFCPDYSRVDQITTQNQEQEIAAEYTPLDRETLRPYVPLVEAWAWSVQKEASRFFEAIGQMYRRGWQYQNDQGDTVKLKGSRALYCVEGEDEDRKTGAPFTRLKWWREPLDYLWVAENPDRIDEETGEVLGENPHIHVMMRWRVPYQHFQAWAARLEKLWGQGMAHLEKIKEPSKAGAYVAKAAGYLCKAQGKGDQGSIRGNRYGISKRARAPGWIECERHQVGMMGWLLAEANEAWQRKHGEKIQRRERLKSQLEQATTGAARQKIGRILEGVRKELEPLPKVSKYGAIFKSETQKDQFMTWARKQGWSEKPQCSQWLHQWRREQLRRRNGARLFARDMDWADWFALADAGAVACNDEGASDADYNGVHLPGLSAASA